MLFAGLDDFKTINDIRGHELGDPLTKQVVQHLLACVRDTDTVARFGGDELVIILEFVAR